MIVVGVVECSVAVTGLYIVGHKGQTWVQKHIHVIVEVHLLQVLLQLREVDGRGIELLSLIALGLALSGRVGHHLQVIPIHAFVVLIVYLQDVGVELR